MLSLVPLCDRNTDLLSCLADTFKVWLSSTSQEARDKAAERLRVSGVYVAPLPHIVTRYTHHECRVYDANGLEWRRLRWVNTETGQAEQMNVDAEGQRMLGSQIVSLALPVLIVPIKAGGKDA